MRTGTAASAPIATVIGVAEDVWMHGRFRFGDFDPRARLSAASSSHTLSDRRLASFCSCVPPAIRSRSRARCGPPSPRSIRCCRPTTRARWTDPAERGRNVRFAALLMSVYGVMALTFAGFGLYAVLSFAVVRRTREIGVRMALGAARSHVVGPSCAPASSSSPPAAPPAWRSWASCRQSCVRCSTTFRHRPGRPRRRLRNPRHRRRSRLRPPRLARRVRRSINCVEK